MRYQNRMKAAPIRNLLVVRLSSLGDVVLATGALPILRERFPGARIRFLTKPDYAPLLERHPDVDEILPLRGGLGATIARLRSEGVDLIVDLHRNLRSRALRWGMPGVRSVAVRNHALRRRLLVWTRLGLSPPPSVLDRFREAALRSGGGSRNGRPPGGPLPSIHLSEEERAGARRVLAASGLPPEGPLVALHPGARWATKRWGLDRFEDLSRRIARAGGRVAVFGSEDDREAAEGVARAAAPRGASFAGGTDLRRLAALLAECRAFVSNDSGPMHLASAVGRPVVAVFGPTVEGFGFSPRGADDRVLQVPLDCRPCSLHGSTACPLGHHLCMDLVTVESVWRRVEAMLAAGRARAA